MESEESTRVAVVTGAGGGLGRRFAVALAAAEWRIAALGRTQATLDETLSEVSEVAPDSGPHLALTCDIVDEEAVARTFARIAEELGGVDLLVNNAGVPGPTGELHTISAEDWRATLETNLTGTFLCTQQAFALMAARGGGRIVNNGSIAAHAPRAGAAAYAATKAAIASLTVSTALDGRPYGIAATELDIGNARTALLGSFTGTEPMFDAERAADLLVAVAALPTDVSVDQLTVTATGMPYLGRG